MAALALERVIVLSPFIQLSKVEFVPLLYHTLPDTCMSGGILNGET